jgi:hypothetical protein
MYSSETRNTSIHISSIVELYQIPAKLIKAPPLERYPQKRHEDIGLSLFLVKTKIWIQGMRSQRIQDPNRLRDFLVMSLCRCITLYNPKTTTHSPRSSMLSL